MEQLYRTKVAVAVLGLKSRQAFDYWLHTNVITPHIKPQGRNMYWSFSDLVALRTLKTLYTAGIPLQQIRKVLAQLNKWGHDLSESYLIVRQGDVHLVTAEAIVSLLRQPGQMESAVIIDLGVTKRDVTNIIEAHNAIDNQQPFTAKRNTAIPEIVEKLRNGERITIHMIAKRYEVTGKTAISYIRQAKDIIEAA